MPPERSEARLRLIDPVTRGGTRREVRLGATASAFSLRFTWPPPVPGHAIDNFFVGIWHPHRAITVSTPPAATQYAEDRGANWWLASAVSPVHPADTGLVHAHQGHGHAVAFRGYVVEPALHSYSSGADILHYWTRPGPREHNGVFSTALIAPGGASLTLITDAFGLGPLYYRRLGDAIAFSTSPRYLAAPDDGPDWVAWRCMLEAEFIAGDRSLTTGIQRVPAGKLLNFGVREERTVAWFDFGRLPDGARRVDHAGLLDMEDCLQQAVSRCLRLDVGRSVLPLSSGHDSRRILAALLAQRAEFTSLTARVFQWGHRDLDGPYASQIAAAYGFPHEVVEPAEGRLFTSDDRVRRVLVDAETTNHTWVVRLFNALPHEPTLVFDGILGDILGQPGFRLPGLYRSPESDLQMILEHCVQGAFDPELRSACWPSVAEVRADMRAYLSQFLGKSNLAELAFILMRQRRSTALWAQQLLGPGRVVACPYADLDYVKLMLDFLPADKHATVCQKACLRTFWPDLARFPGNRDIPTELPPGSPAFAHSRQVEAFHTMWREITRQDGRGRLLRLLTPRALGRVGLSRVARPAAVRSAWCLNPLFELMSREVNRRPCWDSPC